MVVAEAVRQPERKEKVVPPSPPRIIRDRSTGNSYTRTGFLGEGGFARVFEIQDTEGGRKAIKVVNKSTLVSKKNKTKLWAEIKLHQMLSHPHIVKFEDCFEDEENVYMMLELCESGSLMDILRRRKRYTEPEARVILVQIIAACLYMHQTNVIHRDLKLGNIFLDGQMNVKVGDFGLAALIEKPGDRKKTICGTPNYIAPEVLFDSANGHSFEVDIWSVGVILYTLLIGRPPFQTKDVKAIYKRIKENRYEFPPDKEISESAKDLVMIILNPEPDKRPTLEAILHHRWFKDGPFPPYLPVSAHDTAPDYRRLTATESRRNFEGLCHRAKIGAASTINTDHGRIRANLGPSIMQQERDFKYAVQPDSPVGALLQSARQPLVQAPAQIKEPSLLRKLTAAGAQATLSPVRRGVAPPSRDREYAAGPSRRPMPPVGEEDEPAERYDPGIRERELANQKARIVTQMAEAEADLAARRERERIKASPKKPLAPATTVSSQPFPTRQPVETRSATRSREAKGGLFETVGRALTSALDLYNAGQVYKSPRAVDPQPPRVFVVSWVDYCQRYGMGWVMSDKTIGVHFNDSSTVALSPTQTHIDHIYHAPNSEIFRKNYRFDSAPPELRNKVNLLDSFRVYMLDRLAGGQQYCFKDETMHKGMVFVSRYLRMKHVIVFRLSNEIIQFNFFDHSKVIFSDGGMVLTFIDKQYAVFTWSVEEFLALQSQEMDAKEKKRIDGIMHKVQYSADVLLKIHVHTGSGRLKKTSGGLLEPRIGEKAARQSERPIRS